MDWNVFFSTISQTSGAIVGIFAAFLITKIISNQSEFSKLKNEAIHHLIDSESAAAETDIRYFKWYNERKREIALRDMADDFWKNEQLPPVSDCILKFTFSPFDDYEQVKHEVSDKITELSQQLEARKLADEARRAGHVSIGSALSQGLTRHLSEITHPELQANLNKEREAIEHLTVKIERQAKRNSALCAELKCGADSVHLVTCSIAAVLILFFAGVIYPLSFLPWEEGKTISLSFSAFWDIFFSLRGLMLTLISLIFSTLMITFLVINSKLRHHSGIVERITYYSNVSNYSPYLANYMKNNSN